MTPEAQRIAIAEACGWKPIDEVDRYGNRFYKRNNEYARVGVVPTRCSELPNYLNDLNAIHEAEKMLDEKQRARYVQYLLNLEEPEFAFGIESDDACSKWLFPMGVHTTAAQRAEAFLRTIDKWKE